MLLYLVVIVPFLWIKLCDIFGQPPSGVNLCCRQVSEVRSTGEACVHVPIYVAPRKAVRLYTIVLDPHPTGCMHPGVVVWRVSLTTGVIIDFGHFDKLSDRIVSTPAYYLENNPRCGLTPNCLTAILFPTVINTCSRLHSNYSIRLSTRLNS